MKAATGPQSGVIDPTENVIALVQAESKRLDDMRNLVAAHASEVSALRAEYDEKLRKAETARIDAIRAVDVGAVNRAAEVSATQAITLATQVATSAETLRTQVAAAATAAAAALAAALEPIQKSIEDLRRAQYEAQGQKAQVGESRLNVGAVLGGVSVLLVIVFGVISLVLSSAH
jgi:hypothetical protein